MSAEYTLNPLFSSTTLCLPPPTVNIWSKTDFVWCSQRFDARNKRRMHTAYNPDLAHHTSAPSQRLIHTNPCSAAPTMSPNSAAPLNTPHSAMAASVDIPQPAALGNCQLSVYQASQWPLSQSRSKLKQVSVHTAPWGDRRQLNPG